MPKDRESIIETIRKCLALSRSSNEHEAAEAGEKVSLRPTKELES